MIETFRSLRGYNYRTWALGAIVSNVGTWMQRTAQDWLVLAELTHGNATAVGTVMALQFGPQVLLLPLTGFAADHLDRRKLLFATQATMGALALGLGLLTIIGRRSPLARLRVRVLARLRDRVRRAGAPGLRLGSRARGGARERRRAELDVLQRRAHDRPVDRRPPHRAAGVGLGVRDQRGVVRRRARLARAPPQSGVSHRAARGAQAREPRSKAFAYVWRRPRSPGGALHALLVRHVRAEFSASSSRRCR